MKHLRKTQLFGSDEHGQVYDYGNKIVRQISPAYFGQVDKLYSLYLKHQLSKIGVVQTTINHRSKQLIHEKHLISYPHEWTYSMLEDCAIFQLDFVLKLNTYGLTLKDLLPNNVIFNHAQPVFVDFLSLIRSERLQREKWLYVGVTNKNIPAHKLLFSKMFVPHLLIPLFFYAKHDYAKGRMLLETNACNLGNGRPTWTGSFHLSTLFLAMKSLWLANFPGPNYLKAIHQFLDVVSVINLTDPHSAYLNYYQAKGEDYSLKSRKSWKNKQKNVYQIIRRLRPKTTLDIGANTGWYSLLAENLGSSVISTDVDEGTIDSLYLKVKQTHQNILPLVLSFADFIRPTSSKAYLHPIIRFRSDLVMCLALIHHLVLGQGISVDTVIHTLAKLSKRVVILEYVDINDEKIEQDPSFFPLIMGPARQMYNLQSIVKIARKHFSKVDIMDSTESSRKLLIMYH